MQTPPTNARPPSSRPMPVFGCVALVVVAVLGGALAVGGSFWGWMVVGAVAIIGGIAVLIYLARRNARPGPPVG